jgi:transcriptional regulator of arginine metabolism
MLILCAFSLSYAHFLIMPAEAELRQKRHKAILEILQHQSVARQAQLVELLRQKGIEATQSSVSRDLKHLGIPKLDTGYAEPESIPVNDERKLPLLSSFVQDIKTAGMHLTVIQTAVGAAQRVAVYLDRSGWPEIVGTVSGDDTIFVATRNNADQQRLLVKLRAQFMASQNYI